MIIKFDLIIVVAGATGYVAGQYALNHHIDSTHSIC